MTLLHEAVDSKKLDVRVVERNIERGVVRPQDADQALKNLQDDADNAMYVSIDEIAKSEEGTPSSHRS